MRVKRSGKFQTANLNPKKWEDAPGNPMRENTFSEHGVKSGLNFFFWVSRRGIEGATTIECHYGGSN